MINNEFISDIGFTTRAALYKADKSTAKEVRIQAFNQNNKSESNGSLMRIAPVAVIVLYNYTLVLFKQIRK